MLENIFYYFSLIHNSSVGLIVMLNFNSLLPLIGLIWQSSELIWSLRWKSSEISHRNQAANAKVPLDSWHEWYIIWPSKYTIQTQPQHRGAFRFDLRLYYRTSLFLFILLSRSFYNLMQDERPAGGLYQGNGTKEHLYRKSESKSLEELWL